MSLPFLHKILGGVHNNLPQNYEIFLDGLFNGPIISELEVLKIEAISDEVSHRLKDLKEKWGKKQK